MRQASNPALGMVVKVTTADLNDVTSNLASSMSLAAGYVTLYQGQSATGASPGVDPSVSGVDNGNLSTIEGAGSQPGSPTASTAYLPPGTGPAVPIATPGPDNGALVRLPRPSHRCDQVPFPRRIDRPPPGAEQLHPRRSRSAHHDRLDRPDRQRRHDQLAARWAAHHRAELRGRKRCDDSERQAPSRP